jgi:transcriptional regulator with XRE-family HTH domain
MLFSDEIKKLRKKLLLSQTAFAQEIGVSYTTVNRWEMGRAKPSYKTLKAIDDYCSRNNIEFDVRQLINEIENDPLY